MPLKFAVGVNFNPALPSAKVMNVLLGIGVIPSFLNREPLVMLVILKCVTSVLSTAFRLMTSPEVVCVSSFVDESVTVGVSAIGVTAIEALTVLPPRPPSTLLVEAWTVKLKAVVGLNRLAAGVNFNP